MGLYYPKLRHAPSATFLQALAIFRGCAGSSGPSLLVYAIGTIISWTGLFHESKYVNIKFIKMQNRATINLYLGAWMCVCVHYPGNALVGPSMCSFMRTARHAAIGSTVCQNVPFWGIWGFWLIGIAIITSPRKPPTSILNTTYVDV